MMKVGLLCAVLCFAALALRVQAQDSGVVFLPPTDLDKNAPPVDVDEGKPSDLDKDSTPDEKPTEPTDEDKTFDQDNGKHDPTTAPPSVDVNDPPAPPNLEGPVGGQGNTEAPAPTAQATTTVSEETSATTSAPVVPSENCTGVRCSLEVLSTCAYPVLLPGRCCPSCPNRTVCSGVRCGYGKICSEHRGRAICCDRHSRNAHSRRARLHRSLNAVNKFGENCSLRYEPHEYVRVCHRGSCMQNETCYPLSKYYATCCNRRNGSQPVCYITRPKIPGRCAVPPSTDIQKNCTCRVAMTLPLGFGRYPFGYRRRSFDGHLYGGYYGGHHGDAHGEYGGSTFISVMYSYSRGQAYIVYCKGPADVCRAKLGGRRRSRRSLGYLDHFFNTLRNGTTRRVRKQPKRYQRTCRHVRV